MVNHSKLRMIRDYIEMYLLKQVSFKSVIRNIGRALPRMMVLLRQASPTNECRKRFCWYYQLF